MGENKFELIATGLYNGHFAWSNEPEVISFVNQDEKGGNWLLDK